MKRFSNILACCSVFVILPVLANAAGTYYTKSANQQRSYNRYTNVPRTTTPLPTAATNTYQTVKTVKQPVNVQKNAQNSSDVKHGFYIGTDFSHEFASWKFDMVTAGSMLHYDNIGWNVFGANAGYKFGTSVPFQIDGGFRYGMQSGESTMVDDDITNGGFIGFNFGDGLYSIRHALSVGATKDGKMLEFNVGIGLTDVFKIGNLKFTPSVGYRYLKYKLRTENNYGMEVDTIDAYNNCFVDDSSGETQCNPMLVFFNVDSEGRIKEDIGEVVYIDITGDEYADLAPVKTLAGYDYISTEDSYFYQQPGITHLYDVIWSGPYVAMDMRYDINQYNFANARIELGFPGYESTGDQPYRFDLQHPTSFKDKADMFQAFHLGLSADWMTAITDSLSLSLGVTYDYYNVDKVDATTYFNSLYYDGISENTLKEEIKSTYKSLGANIGLSIRF